VKYSTLLEIVAAVHIGNYVSTPFGAKAGVFLCAPPGSLKTTITEVANSYSRVCLISDINVATLVKMKEAVQGGQVRTLAFTDYSKLYKRNPAVGKNLEGHIMAFADEGFRRASFQSQTISTSCAKCTIIGAMTSGFFDEKIDEWMSNGFYRRFLFARYSVANPELIEQALLEERLAKLDGAFIPKVPLQPLDFKLTEWQRQLIEKSTLHYPYKNTAIIMMERIFKVLIWKFGAAKAQQIFLDFAPCLSKDGGMLVLEEKKK
jgi:hypothetical protein